MSRIGKAPIHLPGKVTFTYKDFKVVVEGPKGKLERSLVFDGKFEMKDNILSVISDGTDGGSKAFHGLVRSLVNSMVVGVSEGFSKSLKIVGVGYKAQMQGKALLLTIGYSHTVSYAIPDGISIEVPDQNTITVTGIDKQLVGQVAADIRRFRGPEPYKGKGIRYSDETVRRKAGKTVVK